MITIGKHEIEHRGDCWELRCYRPKKPTAKNPEPIGDACDKTWHATLEQAAMTLADRDAGAINFANDVRAAMAQTRGAIVAAIAASKAG